MDPLNHVLDRGQEPLSREGDLLEIMCPLPLKQWTHPVFAPAGHNTLPAATPVVCTAYSTFLYLLEVSRSTISDILLKFTMEVDMTTKF